MSDRPVAAEDVRLPETTPESFRRALVHHLAYTVGKDPEHASTFDWRLAQSLVILSDAAPEGEGSAGP